MIRFALVLALALCLAGVARAQVGSPSQCGPTSIGTSPSNLTFPATGVGGPPRAQYYITLSNPSAAAQIWVNPTGTASINGAGSFLLTAGSGQTLSWSAQLGYPPPATISVVASGAATPLTCAYQ